MAESNGMRCHGQPSHAAAAGASGRARRCTLGIGPSRWTERHWGSALLPSHQNRVAVESNGIDAGPRFISNKGQMSVLFQADRRTVNGTPYSRQYGLRVEAVRLVTRRIWAGGSVEGSRQTALSLEGPIGKAGLSWNMQTFVHYSILPSLSVRLIGGSGR